MTLLPLHQALHLQKIDNNPGILPVKEGQAFKEEDKWVIVKILDLSGISSDLDYHTLKYSEFVRLVDSHKPFVNEFMGIRTQVEYIRNTTVVKLRQLVPFPLNRYKRGLINPLGSLIKAVSGNLDNDDAIRYDSLISRIGSKEMIMDKKMTMITRMLDNFVNSTETLHENTLILDKRLKVIEELIKYKDFKENVCLYLTYVLSMFDTFLSVFRTIYVTLNEIEIALALSKVSVLHQSIINSTELLYILKSIEQVHSLVYKADENNLLKLERLIKVKAYVKENQITFILEVPLTDKNIYNYFKIYSLPIYKDSINKTVVVFPEFPYLLVKDSKYLPVTKACEKIAADNNFLCNNDNVAQFSTLTCAEQLLEFQVDPTSCVPYAVDIEDIKVHRISLDSWIVFTRKPTVVVEKCSHDNIKESLYGTYIITTTEGCEVYLDEYKLRYQRTFAENFQIKITPIVTLPQLKLMNKTSLVTVNIKNINLEEMKHFSRILNLKDSAFSESEDEISGVTVKSISLGTLLLYLILGIVFIAFLVYRFMLMRNDRITASLKSDNFALEEGGVMQPASASVITTPNA